MSLCNFPLSVPLPPFPGLNFPPSLPAIPSLPSLSLLTPPCLLDEF